MEPMEPMEPIEPWEEIARGAGRFRALLSAAAAVFLAAAVLAGPAAAPVQAGVGTWTPFGPADGSAGGVTALAADPVHPGTLYVQAGSDVFRSNDGGASWAWSGDGLPGGGWIVSLAVAPDDPAVVYATDGNSLYRSADAGHHWSKASSFSNEFHCCYDVRIAALPGGVVFLDNAYGIWRSSDAGDSWTFIAPAEPRVRALAVSPGAPRRVFAAYGGKGVRVSDDAGATWGPIVAVDNGPDAYFWNPFDIAFAPSRPDTVYIGAGNGLYRSEDGGATWVHVSGFSSQHLAVDPASPHVLYASHATASGGADHGVFRSDDGGATWRQLPFDLHGGPAVTALAIEPTLGTLYAGTVDLGVLALVGGRSWTERTATGLPPGAVRWVKIRPGSPNRIVLRTDTGVFRSDDDGLAWKRLVWDLPAAPDGADNDLSDLAFDPADPAVLYGASRIGVLRSIDGGESWSDYSHGASPSSSVLLLRGRSLFANAGCGLRRSDDGGRTWPEVLGCFADPPANSVLRLVWQLAADPGDPLGLYAVVPEIDARSLHPHLVGQYVYASRDGGATWTRSPLPATHLAIDPSDPATLYAGDSTGAFKSLDRGLTWQHIADLRVTGLVVDRHSPATVLASTYDQGVLRSADGGLTWNQVNAGLARRGRLNIVALVEHPDDPHRFFAIPYSLDTTEIHFNGGIFAADFPPAHPAGRHHSHSAGGIFHP
ncbi:MAG TPA: hypothetical protein VHQ90_02125 [Thermoanaerobaculia bacterium]|nr:hypothetical protein [Thermoanaerobaculia bacterium]